MSLDFYLPKYNMAIECQGEQHYKPIEYFGGEKEYNALGRSEYVKYQNYLGSETTSGSLLFQLKKLNDELSELSAELDTIDNQRLALVEQAQMTHSSYGFTNKELVTVSRLQRHTDYQNSNILSTFLSK